MTEAFRRVKDVINGIPGDTMGIKDAEFLHDLCMATDGEGDVVEIGTNVGKSTIALSAALQAKNDVVLNTVDIYKNDGIEKNLTSAGVRDHVNLIVEPSHKVAKRWNSPIKFLFIDGDHSYVGVMSDIKNWSKHVRPGGIIILDDYPGHKSSDVISKAVRRTYFKYPHEYRVTHDRTFGRFIVFQKIEAPREKKGNYFYWQYRNLRGVVSRMLPGLTRRIIKIIHSQTRKKP